MKSVEDADSRRRKQCNNTPDTVTINYMAITNWEIMSIVEIVELRSLVLSRGDYTDPMTA